MVESRESSAGLSQRYDRGNRQMSADSFKDWIAQLEVKYVEKAGRCHFIERRPREYGYRWIFMAKMKFGTTKFHTPLRILYKAKDEQTAGRMVLGS